MPVPRPGHAATTSTTLPLERGGCQPPLHHAWEVPPNPEPARRPEMRRPHHPERVTKTIPPSTTPSHANAEGRVTHPFGHHHHLTPASVALSRANTGGLCHLAHHPLACKHDGRFTGQLPPALRSDPPTLPRYERQCTVWQAMSALQTSGSVLLQSIHNPSTPYSI